MNHEIESIIDYFDLFIEDSDLFRSVLEDMAETPAGPTKYHGEGSVLTHSIMALSNISFSNPEEHNSFRPREQDLAVFLHDVGKITTDESDLPHHPAHEISGCQWIRENGPRLGIDDDIIEVIAQVCRMHGRFQQLDELNPHTLLKTEKSVRNTPLIDGRFMLRVVGADKAARIPPQSFHEQDVYQDLIDEAKNVNRTIGTPHVLRKRNGSREDYSEDALEQMKVMDKVAEMKERKDEVLD